MTPDPRLVKLVNAVRHQLPPDWEPPALPDGDTSDLLDRLAVGRLRDVLTLADAWPADVRDQTVGVIELVIDALGHDGARATAKRAAAKRRAWEAAKAAGRAASRAADAASLAAWGAAAGDAAWSADQAAGAAAAAWSAHAAAWTAYAAAAYAAAAALEAAWQREADRITAAIQEQS